LRVGQEGQHSETPEFDGGRLKHAMVLVGPIPENTFTVRTHGRQQKPPTDANGDIKRHVVGQGMAGIRSDQSPFTIKPHEVTGHNAERNDDEVANAERVLKSSYDAGAGDIRCVIGSGVGARHGLSRVKRASRRRRAATSGRTAALMKRFGGHIDVAIKRPHHLSSFFVAFP